MIFSGVSAATSSMFMPPAREAIISTRRVRAVDQGAEIQFLGDIGGFFDQDIADRQPFGAGLLGHDAVAEHPFGFALDLFRRVDQDDAAGLAATTGVRLCLDHPALAAHVIGRLARLLGGFHRITKRHRNAVTGK